MTVRTSLVQCVKRGKDMKDVRNEFRAERVTPDGGQYFFGYYDISPESLDGREGQDG